MSNIKLEVAKAAVDELFGDSSVSQETTIDLLEDLKDQIDGCIEAIKSDMDAGRGG